ncbi:hypothetical protein BS47DRAFT_1330084, partial [Hydnum rufescens UP504]
MADATNRLSLNSIPESPVDTAQPITLTSSPSHGHSTRRLSRRRESTVSVSPDGRIRRVTSPSPSPPPSAPVSPNQFIHHVPQIPTKSLLTSLAGAAHYSGPSPVRGFRSSHDSPASLTLYRTKLDPVRQRILDDVLKLFCGQPSPEALSHWHKDAILESPLTRCEGYRQCAAQWYALATMVSSSRTVSHRVLASTSSPSRIVYSQTQEYTIRYTHLKRVIQSMVAIHLDNNDQIVMLEDKWKGDDQPATRTALFFRKFNARAVSLLFQSSKKGAPCISCSRSRSHNVPPTTTLISEFHSRMSTSYRFLSLVLASRSYCSLHLSLQPSMYAVFSFMLYAQSYQCPLSI